MSQHPHIAMMGESENGSVHGSIPHNYSMSNLGQAQQQYSQLPLRKEVDEEGRICAVVLPKNATEVSSEQNDETNLSTKEDHPSHLASEEEDERLIDSSHEEIKTEIEDDEHVTGKGTKKRKKKKGSKIKTRVKRSGNIFHCEDCPATFHTPYLIKAHAKVHLEDSESHLCTACGIVFSKLGPLMRHRLEVHQDALQCPHCDKQYTAIKAYQFHVNTHKEDKDRPFVCEICGKGYFSRTSLEEHYLKHSGFKPFMCGICEKFFKTIRNLTEHHQKVHSGEPKICGFCGKTFENARQLAGHQKIHTSAKVIAKRPKILECLQCGWSHIKKSKFLTHMRTHTGEKPFVCNLCDARFTEKSSLKRHKMTHTGVKPFKCNYCPSAFLTKRERKMHNMVHTGKPYQCQLCDYSCLKKHSMEYHMNTHSGKTPYKCDFQGCNAEYSSPNHLRTHKFKLHLPPPLKTCKLCNEKFTDLKSLNQHMAIHAGNNLLSCDQCDKVFYDQSSLNRHAHKHNKLQENKPKQIRRRKNNPEVKREDKHEITQKKFSSDYQVPVTVPGNGHSAFNPSWTQGTIPAHQPHFQPHFLASQYPNLDPTRATTIDPEELRQRLFNSFK